MEGWETLEYLHSPYTGQLLLLKICSPKLCGSHPGNPRCGEETRSALHLKKESELDVVSEIDLLVQAVDYLHVTSTQTKKSLYDFQEGKL